MIKKGWFIMIGTYPKSGGTSFAILHAVGLSFSAIHKNLEKGERRQDSSENRQGGGRDEDTEIHHVHTYIQTDRQTDTHTHRQTDTHTHR